jgi:anti-sigma factor RsiW
MNSSDWEERVALHAGGDLPPAEAAEVERHLRECAACQVLASGLKQSLALLKEAHHEPLAPAHFSAVRARVVAELEQERRRGALWARRRAWGYGPAAVAVTLLVVLALRPGRVPVVANTNRSLTVAALSSPVVAVREPATPPQRSVARRKASRAPAPQVVPDREPLIVKLLTDDPNVVIYWIADGKRGD